MPLPIAIGSLILGGLQAGISAYNLHKLNKTPQPNYSITPELQKSYSRAQDRTGYGFSPEQRSDYFSGIAGRYNQGLRNASDLSGGQMASAFGRGMQASQLRDFSNFAAQDAAQQQQNIRYADQVGGQMTNQRNMIAQQEIENRRAKEVAFGGGLSSGLNNIAGAANFFAMNGGFNQPGNTVVTPQGQLAGNGFSANGVNTGPINPGVPPSPPVGGWLGANQAAMNSTQYDYTPDGLPIDQAAVPFNNTGMVSSYGTFSPWGGMGQYYRQ